jgi:hypothetical protein
MSAVLKRDSGTPRVAGNSQASAPTWTTTSGGKSSGTARAGTLVQAGEAFIEESLAPEADDVAPDGEGGRDLVIGATLGGEQHDERSQNLKVWQRILPGAIFECPAFCPGERDDILASSWHAAPQRLEEG